MPIRFLTLIAAFALASTPAIASFDTKARGAYVVDLNTDTIILRKNAEEPLPPASMSKLMTLYMLFEALEDGRVDLSTPFRVSTRARKMGGSTMFLDETDRPTAEELVQGIVVLSGNDACVVVAEGLAGSEEAFAGLMNEKARDIGLTNSNFVNSSGWPHPEHRMSMKDLATLTRRLYRDFPQYYGYFAQREFPYDGRAPDNRFNRNPLLSLGIGADGLKTGHTQEAGYGLVGSAAQGDRRVVFVLGGLESQKERAEEAERVVTWAFRQFSEKTVLEKGQSVVDAPVWMGSKDTVPLVSLDEVTMLLPASTDDKVQARVIYDSPLPAPIAEGQELGRLILTVENQPDREVTLIAGDRVREVNIILRIGIATGVLARRVKSVFN